MSTPTEVRCDGCGALADPESRFTFIGYKHCCGGTWRHSPAPLSPVSAPAEDRTPLMQSLAESDKRAKELPQWAVAIERAHAQQYGGHVSTPAYGRTSSEDDGYDMLRLRVSDPDLPWTDRDRAALDKLLREHARLTAALDRANRALDEIIALDEKGPAWEPYDEFGDPSDIDISNSGEHRLHGAWTAFQYAAKIARAVRTQPEGSNG